ncbi:MAG: hypothetical protein N3A58_01710 [Spirochaetes bacterium]|nr:hypothetical protein [Spirochaetota bacterium]
MIFYFIRLYLSEPISYIIKSREFYKDSFYIEKGVLIPRHESEILVSSVSDCLKDKIGINYDSKMNNFNERIINSDKSHNKLDIEEYKILEVGVGSGALIISLIFDILNFCVESIYFSKNLNFLFLKNLIFSFIGIDKYEKPIKITNINFLNIFEKYKNEFRNKGIILSLKKEDKLSYLIEVYKINSNNKNYEENIDKIFLIKFKFQIKKIDFLKLKFEFNKININNFDIIFANPPYISKLDYNNLDKKIKCFEPKNALYGKVDGDFYYENYIYNIEKKLILKNDGYIFFEVGDDKQAERVENIFRKYNYNSFYKEDYSGVKRVVFGTKKL